MHAELVVPALLPDAGAPPLPATPALDLLLARGRRAADEPSGYEGWLAAQCGLDEQAPLPAGALTLLAEGCAPGDATWMRADPVHLRLGRTDASIVPAAAFDVDPQESASLAEALNRHYAGELHFEAVQPRHWCVRLAAMPGISARPTAEVAGGDAGSNLPQGDDANLWHARLNEIQMLLHAHPVNQARETRGLPAINSLWFWGAGSLPAPAGLHWRSVSADEPVARGLAVLCGQRAQPLPDSAAAWLAQLPGEGRHLAVLDALRTPRALGDGEAWREGLEQLEADWLAPLVDALRAGRIGMLTLHLPDGRGTLACETVRGDLRRFWRRPKPLTAYA